LQTPTFILESVKKPVCSWDFLKTAKSVLAISGMKIGENFPERVKFPSGEKNTWPEPLEIDIFGQENWAIQNGHICPFYRKRDISEDSAVLIEKKEIKNTKSKKSLSKRHSKEYRYNWLIEVTQRRANPKRSNLASAACHELNESIKIERNKRRRQKPNVKIGGRSKCGLTVQGHKSAGLQQEYYNINKLLLT